MTIRLFLATATLVASIAAPMDAAAFNCTIPGIFSAAKKTVCANPLLAELARSELASLDAVSGNLQRDARGYVARDRRTFLAQRDRCGRDERCHEATYGAQSRLYGRIDEACTLPTSRQLVCVTRIILKHRQELHRSM